MAKHWTEYAQGGASKPQADLLDLLAVEANKALDECAAAGVTLQGARRLADGKAVLEWCMIPGAPSKAEASAAIDRAKEKIAARRAKITSAAPRAAALAEIKRLMAAHSITVGDLS